MWDVACIQIFMVSYILLLSACIVLYLIFYSSNSECYLLLLFIETEFD